jgi:hypothetical protein
MASPYVQNATLLVCLRLTLRNSALVSRNFRARLRRGRNGSVVSYEAPGKVAGVKIAKSIQPRGGNWQGHYSADVAASIIW